MTINKPIETLTIEDETIELTPDMLIMLNMSRAEFIETNKAYLKELGKEFYTLADENGEGGKIDPLKCPLHLWVVYNRVKCSKELVSNTAVCPLCANPVCPDCMNHKVDQLSRVTGYMSAVSGWNAAKRQELKDRLRYNLSGTNTI